MRSEAVDPTAITDRVPDVREPELARVASLRGCAVHCDESVDDETARNVARKQVPACEVLIAVLARKEGIVRDSSGG